MILNLHDLYENDFKIYRSYILIIFLKSISISNTKPFEGTNKFEYLKLFRKLVGIHYFGLVFLFGDGSLFLPRKDEVGVDGCFLASAG